jgi:hypothetical protein
MTPLIEQLKPKEQRGSKPRCHLLTHGTADEVAAALTALVAPFASVMPTDSWMPVGFAEVQEAKLNKAPRLLNAEIRRQLGAWWLPAERQTARTPNFDIASTCKVGDGPGLLLIEAKAHAQELRKEEAGRVLDAESSDDRKASHNTIGAAIAEAAGGLTLATAAPCHISRDTHYQMSNRFAWAWKLTELGIPVVLVYLGFLHADEMQDRGAPLGSHDDWQELVQAHSAPLFQVNPWEQVWKCNGQSLVPLIRSIKQPLGGGSQ